MNDSILDRENLPPGSASDPDLWNDRFEDINAFEHHLSRNGTDIVKLPDKNWKFSAADVHQRTFWNGN